MALSPQYKSYVVDLFEPLGPVRVRAMFGGGGVYYKDTMFALISDETLYLKADDTNKAAFEAEGCSVFVYGDKAKPISMSYYELPDRLLDDPDELMEWARKSVDVALRTKKPKKKPRKKKTSL